jgi:hypothetical protein
MKGDWMEGLMNIDRRKCFNCGRSENITRHHLMGNETGRIIPLCKKCHDEIDNAPYAKGMSYGLCQGKIMAVDRISRNLHNDGNGKLFIKIEAWKRVKESLKLFPNEIIEKTKKPDVIPEEQKKKRYFKKYMFD